MHTTKRTHPYVSYDSRNKHGYLPEENRLVSVIEMLCVSMRKELST
jgi:hypothetical protein